MVEPPSKKVKIEESFVLSEQQQQLIREDTANKKLWDEALDSLKEGPVGVNHCTPHIYSTYLLSFLTDSTHQRRSGPKTAC